MAFLNSNRALYTQQWRARLKLDQPAQLETTKILSGNVPAVVVVSLNRMPGILASEESADGQTKKQFLGIVLDVNDIDLHLMIAIPMARIANMPLFLTGRVFPEPADIPVSRWKELEMYQEERLKHSCLMIPICCQRTHQQLRLQHLLLLQAQIDQGEDLT